MKKRIIAVIAAMAMIYGTQYVKGEGYEYLGTGKGVGVSERNDGEVQREQGQVTSTLDGNDRNRFGNGRNQDIYRRAVDTDELGKITPVEVTNGQTGLCEDTDSTDNAGVGQDQEASDGPDGYIQNRLGVAIKLDAGDSDGGEYSEGGDTGGGTEETYTEPESVEPEYLETGVDEWIYYGNCRITFYCPAECCCGEWAYGPTASGEMPIAGWTVANGDLPFGTIVMIDGQEYCVTDRGVGGDQFDVHVDTHDEALARGLYYTDVYIKG